MSGLAADLSRPSSAAAMLGRSGMLICPKCRTTYSSPLVEACYRDGEKLVDHDAFVAKENDPLRGATIGGKYKIVERIGQGGMGTVYRAVQSGLNRSVAVKILKRELNVDPDTVARFHREANAMSLLTHVNTVRVYDFGQTDDGLLYLVMELLEGELITQRIQREGVLEVIESIRFTQQILRSLAEAHRKALVHRDLKPDNIFVATIEGEDEPLVKVLDFGIAKVVAPDRRVDQFETQAGTVFGTPRYMSPEQAQGGTLDGRSDLYSVGTLLYQMLTGRAPFIDDDAVVVMAKHIREQPDPPRKAAPDRRIPASLESVVMKALAKDPALRFQEAAEFETALEACVSDALRERDRPTPLVNPLPRPRRTGVIVGITAVIVLSGYVGFRELASGGARRAEGPVAMPTREPVPAAPNDEPPPVIVQVNPASGPTTEPAPEAPSIQPALVSIRSDPSGAAVIRDGRRIGSTPLDLQLSPDDGVVRVELRSRGFAPLAAELTAVEGERLFKLSPKERTQRKARNASRTRSERKPIRTPRKPRRAEEPSGPYERFE